MLGQHIARCGRVLGALALALIPSARRRRLDLVLLARRVLLARLARLVLLLALLTLVLILGPILAPSGKLK